MGDRPACPHPDFEAIVQVDRLEDSGRFVANVHVRCAACRTRFQWQGLPMGLDLNGTMVSVDGFELRGAIRPAAHETSLMANVAPFPEPGQDLTDRRRTPPKRKHETDH